MPRYNMYVRPKDDPIFQSISDRPAWLHNHLQRTKKEMQRKQRKYNADVLEIKQPGQVIKVKVIKKKKQHSQFIGDNERVCRHYAYAGLCPVKGCKHYIGD